MKKWDDHLVQCRNLQEGNRFASTEDVFRKGEMRYIYYHRGMKAEIRILIWGTVKILLDQASMFIMKYNALQVQLYKHLKN